MMDKSAEALTRLWVVFEMYETTLMLKQELEIWTPLGQVGTGLVSSGPIVHALQRVDTSKAEASNACDQRQIMNYVAGENEMTGIKCFKDNSKQLDNTSVGEDYEGKLVHDKKHNFEKLNDAIKENALNDAIKREAGHKDA